MLPTNSKNHSDVLKRGTSGEASVCLDSQEVYVTPAIVFIQYILFTIIIINIINVSVLINSSKLSEN